MRLSELPTGEKAYILKVHGSGAFRKRLLEMGFVRGEEVKAILNAPLKDPIKYRIMGYEVSLRRSEAVMIEISMLKEDTLAFRPWQTGKNKKELDVALEHVLPECNKRQRRKRGRFRRESSNHIIKVALVGNPNSGKTSLFNLASGAHEHVGNYGGVTVDSKIGKLYHKDYTIELVDLPGTYSLSAYTPEERYVRNYLMEEQPDVIINVVAASALERNLYLTTELMDMEVPMVIALNMYDELEQSGSKFDYPALSKMIGIPIVPTVAKKGEGIPELLDETIKKYEGEDKKEPARIPYGRVLERAIELMEREFANVDISHLHFPLRYLCIKLLEGDKEIEEMIDRLPKCDEIRARRDKERAYIEKLLREDAESAFTNARYGFIEGALKETFTEKTNIHDTTRILDAIVTNKYIGLPIFFLFMWLMFEATFRLGEYPMQGIEWLVETAGNFVRSHMGDGPLKDLLVDGIIGGVGGVIVFLPNIVILYLFIAFMEDSGYMARAAFIMDKVMHKMGLHGKSFIPLLMGFGCNVPAILSTRTIESRNSRMITMLIVPFMSCSARLPIYLLFAGTFFSRHAGLVLFGLYMAGILLAILSARLFRKFFFKEEDTPFVMELPPYRLPTFKSVMIHMWERAYQYLKKIGGPILIASIIIWFLGYFPRNKATDVPYGASMTHIETLNRAAEQQEHSYIGQIGKFIEPVMRPLGFDWKMSVSLLSGMAAKEIVISTMGVLYAGDGENQASLQQRLLTETHADGTPVFTPLVVIGFLLFVLIYFPCIATVATIKEESGSWKWALFSVLYSTGMAWIVAFLVHWIGNLWI
jgi:ferrous iron transport protein B